MKARWVVGCEVRSKPVLGDLGGVPGNLRLVRALRCRMPGNWAGRFADSGAQPFEAYN